jgi:TonB family protein
VTLGFPATDEPPAVQLDAPQATLPFNRARMYGLSRAELWIALELVLEQHRFRFAARDEPDGLVITRPRILPDKRLAGLGRPSDFNPRQVELHLYVPAVEPARLYAGSILRGETPSLERRTYFNIGYVEHWLFEQLEKHLGMRGHPIPRAPEARVALSRRLRPDSVPAHCAPDPGVSMAVEPPPSLLMRSKITPIYPDGALRARRSGSVIIRVMLQDDGTLWEPTVLRNTTDDRELETSAVHTISFWRFKPLSLLGCPVSTFTTVMVSYETGR